MPLRKSQVGGPAALAHRRTIPAWPTTRLQAGLRRTTLTKTEMAEATNHPISRPPILPTTILHRSRPRRALPLPHHHRPRLRLRAAVLRRAIPGRATTSTPRIPGPPGIPPPRLPPLPDLPLRVLARPRMKLPWVSPLRMKAQPSRTCTSAAGAVPKSPKTRPVAPGAGLRSTTSRIERATGRKSTKRDESLFA